MTAIIRARGANFSHLLPLATIVLAADAFNRSAGTVLGTTDVGALPWATVHSSAEPSLTGTAMRVRAVETGKSASLVDLGIPAAEVGATWVANSTVAQAGIAGVLARANETGTSGFFFGPAYIGAGSSRWLLARLDNNVLTWLLSGPASGSINRPVVGASFSLRCSGSLIEGRVNGSVLLTTNDTAHAANTHTGIIAIGSTGGNTQSDFDTFKAMPA